MGEDFENGRKGEGELESDRDMTCDKHVVLILARNHYHLIVLP
jgi:hypothetical protein